MNRLERSGYGIPRRKRYDEEPNTRGKYWPITVIALLVVCALLASWGDTISGINPS